MRNLIISLLLLAIGGSSMNAQGSRSGGAFFDKLHFELKAIYGTRQHSMTPMNASMQLSYELTNRLSLMATTEGDYTLFKQNDSKSWARNVSLGGGLAYVIYKGQAEHFDLRLQVLNTVGSNDHSFTTYDLGTTWYGKSSKRSIAPVLGFGFRHQSSHTAGIRDWTGFYATVGVRF